VLEFRQPARQLGRPTAGTRRYHTTGTSKLARGSFAPGPSKGHRSAEYTVNPLASIALPGPDHRVISTQVGDFDVDLQVTTW
jgi:hypothetical protein